MDLGAIPSSVGLLVVKVLSLGYTMATLPFYYIYQKPWITAQLATSAKAIQVDKNDPSSPWVRSYPGPDVFVNNCSTADEVFSKAVQLYWNKPCLGFRPLLSHKKENLNGSVAILYKLGDYQWFTFTQIDERVNNVMNGLISIGVKPKENVVIFSETRLEWMLTAQAVFRLGAAVATLYSTLGDEGIAHGINEVDADVVITSSSLVRKLLRLSAKMSSIKTIVYFDVNQIENPLEAIPEQLQLVSFSDLEERGSAAAVNTERPSPTAEDTAVIMYTSGSTGTPKGVVITHKNLTCFMKNLALMSDSFEKTDLYMACLPLAHIAEFTVEVLFLFLGNAVAYSSPLTLTDKSPTIMSGTRGDSNLIKPSVMFVVPLLLERIRKSVLRELDAKGPFAKGLFSYVLGYKKYWTKKGYKTPIIDRLFCRKLRASIGGNFRLFICGASALSEETEDFIKYGFNMTLLQGYGLTEITCVASLMHHHDLYSGSVGYPSAGVQLRLVDWTEGGYRVTDKPNPRGEIAVAGDIVTKGYYKNPVQTRAAYIQENGVTWFYTGDIGEVLPNGVFKIIDRKKDLVKLLNGEYVALGKVESVLKNCDFVENICVHGSSQQVCPLALITPNKHHLKQLGDKLAKVVSFDILLQDEDIVSIVVKSISECGRSLGLNKSEIPRKVILCREEWTPESGLVTAALKLRRKNVYAFYQNLIDEAYQSN